MPITDLRRLLLLHTPTPPPFVDTFNRADGAVGNGWRSVGSSWTISGNKTATTLTEVERAINPGAEGVYVAGLPPNWTSVLHTGARAEENADVHGGLAAERLSTGVGQNEYVYAAMTGAAPGKWYKVSAWIKCVANNVSFHGRNTDASASFSMNAADAAWAWYCDLIQAAKTPLGPSFWVSTNNSDVIIDDVSMSQLTVPSEFFMLRDYPSKDVTVGAMFKWVSVDPVHPTNNYTTSQQIGGIVVSADSVTDPQNYVCAYHDGLWTYLSKFVAGVETKLITDNSATDAANLRVGAWLEIRKYGTTYQLWVSGVQVGASQTITDVSILNNAIVGIKVNNSSSADSFSVRRYGADYANAKPAAPFYGGSTYPAGNGVLSLRFDDASLTDFTVVYPLLAARGLVGGFALWRNRIGAPGYPTAANFLAMQTAGNEMMCHSWTHGVDPTTWAQFVYETSTVGEEMRLMGYNIDSWVQPGTWVGAFGIGPAALGGPLDYHLRASFPSYMAYAIPFDAGGNRYNLPYSTPYGMQHCAGDTQTLAQLNALLANLIAEGRGAIPLFHSVNIGGGGFISLADFTTWLDNVQIAVAGGNLTVLTPTQAMFATPV